MAHCAILSHVALRGALNPPTLNDAGFRAVGMVFVIDASAGSNRADLSEANSLSGVDWLGTQSALAIVHCPREIGIGS